MADKHACIVKQVQIDWTAQHRGRLFQNPTGYASQEHVKYGLCKGSSDLIGFEYINGKPIFCAVEVKTLAYPYLSKDQKIFLDALIRLGCCAYIAKEAGDNYEIRPHGIYEKSNEEKKTD